MPRILIQGATCVLPDETVVANVLLDGTTLASIDAPRTSRCDEVVDATGLHLIPGVIDDQVHFREPGLTHKEDLHTGSLACARGGVTTYLEMPNTNPSTVTQERLEEKLSLAASKSVVNYGFYVGATLDNLEDLKKASRTPGIKIFIGSSTGNMLVDDQDVLEQIFAETSLPICAHCEDEMTVRENARKLGNALSISDHSRIRDRAAAVISAKRAVDLAHRHGHRFHLLHASTAEEVEILKDHRDRITGEACPHHLFFHVGDYERLGALVQMNPSLKTEADNRALWEGLLCGAIQVVATDHAPHTLEEKKRPYPESPSGLPAVENSLALLLNQVNLGRCTISQVVSWMCDAPARVWDLVGKGRIQEGYDADLVLVDLGREARVENRDQLTKSGWSPWHGEVLTGWPVSTWVMGTRVFESGRVNPQARGREAVFDHGRGGFWKA